MNTGNSFNFAFKNRAMMQKIITTTTTTTTQPNSVVPPPVDKKKNMWGAATWYFLHTICQKIKEDRFDTIQKMQEFRDILYMICTNLPCPDCSNHAKTYLKNISFDKRIYSKEELTKVFFDFHNVVNKRKGYEQFSQVSLQEKYSCSVTRNIMIHFVKNFDVKNKNIPKMISEDFYRKQVINMVVEWFSKHFDCFDS